MSSEATKGTVRQPGNLWKSIMSPPPSIAQMNAAAAERECESLPMRALPCPPESASGSQDCHSPETPIVVPARGINVGGSGGCGQGHLFIFPPGGGGPSLPCEATFRSGSHLVSHVRVHACANHGCEKVPCSDSCLGSAHFNIAECFCSTLCSAKLILRQCQNNQHLDDPICLLD